MRMRFVRKARLQPIPAGRLGRCHPVPCSGVCPLLQARTIFSGKLGQNLRQNLIQHRPESVISMNGLHQKCIPDKCIWIRHQKHRHLVAVGLHDRCMYPYQTLQGQGIGLGQSCLQDRK